jgi:hypothetical protein
MFIKTLIAVALLVALAEQSAFADYIFITCGASSGYTYYMEGPLTPKAPGWKKDGVNSKLQLLIKENGGVDLISSGAPNDFSYSADGCSFSRPPMPLGENELVLVATCPKHIETFFFRWKDDKSGELVSVDIAATPLSNRGGTLYAACKLGQ